MAEKFVHMSDTVLHINPEIGLHVQLTTHDTEGNSTTQRRSKLDLNIGQIG